MSTSTLGKKKNQVKHVNQHLARLAYFESRPPGNHSVLPMASRGLSVRPNAMGSCSKRLLKRQKRKEVDVNPFNH